MSTVVAFGRFWWTFIVGDDWVTAAGVALGLAAVSGFVAAGIDAWWLLPPAVAVVLYASLWRASR